MQEEIELILEDARDRMVKALEHLDTTLGQIRAGKANPKMLDSVMVDYYGNLTALPKIANVNTPDARIV